MQKIQRLWKQQCTAFHAKLPGKGVNTQGSPESDSRKACAECDESWVSLEAEELLDGVGPK